MKIFSKLTKRKDSSKKLSAPSQPASARKQQASGRSTQGAAQDDLHVWCWKETPERLRLHSSAARIGDGFVLYEEADQQELERYFDNQHQMCCIQNGAYVIKFDTMTQTKTQTGYSREVQRGAIVWCWEETDVRVPQHDPATLVTGNFVKYNFSVTRELEAAYRRQAGTGIFCPLPGYAIDFATMLQTNEKTGYQRKVQRLYMQPSSTPGGTLSTAGSVLPAPQSCSVHHHDHSCASISPITAPTTFDDFAPAQTGLITAIPTTAPSTVCPIATPLVAPLLVTTSATPYAAASQSSQPMQQAPFPATAHPSSWIQDPTASLNKTTSPFSSVTTHLAPLATAPPSYAAPSPTVPMHMSTSAASNSSRTRSFAPATPK